MVLAAGVGTRLDPLTSKIPKPLVPVADVAVMEHILKLLGRHGFSDICANVHYLPEKIENYFGDGQSLGLSITFHREDKLSGDAGGVRACRQFLAGGTVIVLSGDLLTDADLTAMIAQHKNKRALASIGIKQVDDVTHFGVVVLDQNGFITGFQEKPKPEEALSHLVSTGIYILEPEVFDHIPPSGEYGFGRQLFPALVKKGLPVLGVELDNYWSDVGTIEQYRLSNFDALAGKLKLDLPGKVVRTAPHLLRLGQGAQVEDMASLEGSLMLGRNSVVKKGAKIQGSVVIGDNCVIHPGAVISNTVIWSNSEVLNDAKVDSCVIASNCAIEATSQISGTALVAPCLPETEVAV